MRGYTFFLNIAYLKRHPISMPWTAGLIVPVLFVPWRYCAILGLSGKATEIYQDLSVGGVKQNRREVISAVSCSMFVGAQVVAVSKGVRSAYLNFWCGSK